MCYRIPLVGFDLAPRSLCCLCLPPVYGVRVMPFVDFFEAVLQILVLTLIFTLQDTWMAQVTLVLAANTAATILKLLAAPTIFCAGIPWGHKGLITTFGIQIYGWVRAAALSVFVWGAVLNWILVTWVIAVPDYYNDPSWGLCSFCLRIDKCRSDYDSYLVQQAAKADSTTKILRQSTLPSFETYFHGTITHSQCQGVNTVVYFLVFTWYFLYQLHYVLAVRQALVDIYAYNSEVRKRRKQLEADRKKAAQEEQKAIDEAARHKAFRGAIPAVPEFQNDSFDDDQKTQAPSTVKKLLRTEKIRNVESDTSSDDMNIVIPKRLKGQIAKIEFRTVDTQKPQPQKQSQISSWADSNRPIHPLELTDYTNNTRQDDVNSVDLLSQITRLERPKKALQAPMPEII